MTEIITKQENQLTVEKTKQCKDCKEVKLLNEFPKDKKGYMGTKTRCKPCMKIYKASKKANGTSPQVENKANDTINQLEVITTHDKIPVVVNEPIDNMTTSNEPIPCTNVQETSYLFDTNLSMKAKGVLSVLMTFNSDNWNEAKEKLKDSSKEPISTLETYIKELRRSGYLEFEAVREKGTIKHWTYTINV